LDKWDTEVSYFIAHHIRPMLNSRLRSLLEREREAVGRRISQRVARVAQQRPAFSTIPASMTPSEFEAFCAESLREGGWGVRLTPLSRDQGVDVIAEKNGVRVVLQCKMYSKPVGNKAVQEVAAGRVHQQANHGAVVTNSTYTTSAKELANTNGIHLLHYTDLPQLEQMLSRPAIQ
ncbi:MAG TPA: restriction endonuclease, partial [Terracidiphilus sp.]|nr:restriction endonuclease [Terracidiphilus sp.]